MSICCWPSRSRSPRPYDAPGPLSPACSRWRSRRAEWSPSRAPATSPALTVGLVAPEQPDAGLPVDETSGRDLLARYVPRVAALVAQGAGIVVLPEAAFGVTDATLPRLVEAFWPATDGGAQVVAGAALRSGDTTRNGALVLGAGGAVTTYAKQHLIPRTGGLDHSGRHGSDRRRPVRRGDLQGPRFPRPGPAIPPGRHTAPLLALAGYRAGVGLRRQLRGPATP